MNESNVVELKAPVEDALGELLKEGARQLLAQAIEAEVAELLIQYADQTVNGKRAVVRNGYLPERSIQTGLGEVPVKVPKVRDRSDGGIKFNSKLVPPYLKRTKNVEEFIPWLYLKGISTGEMQPALEALLGEGATGLSAATVSRLKKCWEADYRQWRQRDLSRRRYHGASEDHEDQELWQSHDDFGDGLEADGDGAEQVATTPGLQAVGRDA